jgi:POT family proton-dependent oligopeptide transporter
VLIGAALMAAGYFVLALDRQSTLYLALGLLILGNGFFKPSIATLVGKLYAPGDPRRDSGFSIFYMGINIGALFAPLVGETLRKLLGWHIAFAIGGAVLAASWVYFLATSRNLREIDPWQQQRQGSGPVPAARPTPTEGPSRALTPIERQRVIALIIMSTIVFLFWLAFQQSGSTLTFWARDCTDRSITLWDRHLQPYRAEIPPGFFAAVPAAFVIILAPLSAWCFGALRARGLEPSTPAKITFGMLMTAGAYMVMVAASLVGGDHGRVSMLWLIASYLVVSMGEVLISPMGLSMVTKLSPQRLSGFLMGLWFVSTSLGNKLAGVLGALWTPWPHHRFFGLLVITSLLAAILLISQHRRLRRAMPRYDAATRDDQIAIPLTRPPGEGGALGVDAPPSNIAAA